MEMVPGLAVGHVNTCCVAETPIGEHVGGVVVGVFVKMTKVTLGEGVKVEMAMETGVEVTFGANSPSNKNEGVGLIVYP